VWRDVLVLGYHAVSKGWPAALAIHPQRLDAQLEELVARGYRGATFTTAVTAPSDRKTLAVTFDDGFRSVFKHALPILSRHGLPGTVFIPTGHVGHDGPMSWPHIDRWIGGAYEEELTGLSWLELAQLKDAGWEIGSHTRSHPHLPALADDVLGRELEASRADLEERLGHRCRSIAYPYGEVDRRIVAAVRRAGYMAAAALPRRIHRQHAFRWPRVGICRNEPLEIFAAKTALVRRRRLDLLTGETALLPRWRFTD
jgi:peptidoglycan/xylan/chitin deacetylase (PgdA/CDA1 family)